MDDGLLFSDWLDPADRQALDAQFLALDKREQDDPWFVWRIEVNVALSNEGMNIIWPDGEDPYSFVTIRPYVLDECVKDHEQIPLIHLREIFEHEDVPANPKGVASYIKAVMYDERFRLWKYDSEDD